MNQNFQQAIKAIEEFSESDPDEFCFHVISILEEHLQVYFAGLFLNDEQNECSIFVAGNGEAGKVMRQRGRKINISGPWLEETLKRGAITLHGSLQTIRYAVQVERDIVSIFPQNIENIIFPSPLLPYARFQLFLPLLKQNHVFGMLEIDRTEDERSFTNDDLLGWMKLANAISARL